MAQEVIVIANRLPVHLVSRPSGPGWETSPGGLVSALHPIMVERGGTWIGWADSAGVEIAPFQHDGVQLLPISLSSEELEGYYDGFSNRTLWPLYHDAIRTPEFRRSWWRTYERVNRRFAEVAAANATHGAHVWVQDYHLQLVPEMLRALRPDLRIGFFLHIPFPPQELFSQLPWRERILEGLLGCDVFGCQTAVGVSNFAELAQRYIGARREGDHLRFQGRTVRFRSFPISIAFDRYARLAASESVRRAAAAVRERLGASRKIFLSVDRLDYTKGIDQRLQAFQQLLESGKASSDECVLVQTCVPCRERVSEYETQKLRVEQLVGRIQGKFGRLGIPAVDYLHRNLQLEDLVALYVAADVMVVTPLRDGMNLVSKEYVASRLDDSGVLVLSEFAGAAHELQRALIVNPHDIDGMADTLYQALHLPREEQRERMHGMRELVRSADVHRWAESFLSALERPSERVARGRGDRPHEGATPRVATSGLRPESSSEGRRHD